MRRPRRFGHPQNVLHRRPTHRPPREAAPRGEFGSAEARGTNEKLPPYAQVVYNDGKGKAAVAVGFNRVLPGSEQARQTVECPDKVLKLYDSCVVTRLPDGSALKIFQGYEYPDRRADTKLWTADLVTPRVSTST